MSELAKRIGITTKKIRKEKGLTQADLAIASQLSQVSISKIESGKVIPHNSSIVSICKALNVSEAEIIREAFKSNDALNPLMGKIESLYLEVLNLSKDAKN